MWRGFRIAAIGLSGLALSTAAQPTASDWVRDDRVFSMGGLYTHRAWSVDAGDIDGDGIDDMVFTTQDGRVEIYRGTGLAGDDAWERRLEWSEDIQLEVPTEPEEEWATRWFVAVTDLNANGRPELFLTCGDSPDPPLCLERSPRQPFRWQQIQGLTEGLSGYIRVASFGDVDGDGDLDMAVYHATPPGSSFGLVLYWNRGTASCPSWELDGGYFLPTLDRWTLLAIELGDVDHDGILDLSILEFCPEWCVCVYLMLNGGTGLQPTWEWYEPPDWWEPICCADRGDLVIHDHGPDGDQDIVLLTAPMGQLYLLENITSNGGLVIGEPDMVAGTISGAEWCRATLSDLDWEGDKDLVTCFVGAEFDASSTARAQYRNDAATEGAVWSSWREFTIPVGGSHTTNHAMGDLDSDCHDDLLVLGNEPAFYWRRGTATDPEWERDYEAASGLPSYAADPSFVDLNNDGLSDFTCRGQGVRSFFRNAGSPGQPVWVEWPSWGEGLPSGTAAFGRLDQDQTVDAVVCASDRTLHSFLGRPGESPPWEQTGLYLSGLMLPFSPTGMILTNLNGAAGNDLSVGLGNGELLYYSNTGPVGGEDAMPSLVPLLAVWPNPNDGQVTIRLVGSGSGPANLALYDLNGRLVERLWQGTIAGPRTLGWRLGSRPPGSYVLRLAASEGTITTRVIVR